MNDRQIEDLILDAIQNRKITWLDMVSGRSISYEAGHKRVFRNNRFKAESWSERMTISSRVAGATSNLAVIPDGVRPAASSCLE